MEKQFEDDDELKKLLEEQYIKEAEEMEAALFADEDFEDYDASDEEIHASYEELVERLKAKGIYQEDEEETDASERSASPEPKIIPMPAQHTEKKEKNTEKKAGRHRHHSIGRMAVTAAVCVICVFAASMTSEANRRYVINQIRVLSGDNARIVVSNDSENDKMNNDEYEARNEIEQKLGVQLPSFLYRSDGLTYKKYSLDEKIGIARLKYQYGENSILLCVYLQKNYVGSEAERLHGNIVENISVTKSGKKIEIVIEQIEAENDKLPNYIAQWKYDDALYSLSGKIELKELEEMISCMRY